MVLSQLKAIKPLLGNSFQHRVRFVLLCLTHQLTKQVTRYQHYDIYNIGERDFDRCFEMNDASLLKQEVIKRLGSSAEEVIDRELGQGSYTLWHQEQLQYSLL